MDNATMTPSSAQWVAHVQAVHAGDLAAALTACGWEQLADGTWLIVTPGDERWREFVVTVQPFAGFWEVYENGEGNDCRCDSFEHALRVADTWRLNRLDLYASYDFSSPQPRCPVEDFDDIPF